MQLRGRDGLVAVFFLFGVCIDGVLYEAAVDVVRTGASDRHIEMAERSWMAFEETASLAFVSPSSSFG